MADIRDRVEEDRGLLKRIQLHIPGFAGYRRREDLRQADSILRLQLANKLKDIRNGLENTRQTFVDNKELKVLEPLGRVIFECQEFEGLIRHAEQGYSGISFAIRVEEAELEHLYEHDLKLLDGLKALEEKIEGMRKSSAEALGFIREFSNSVSDLKNTFKRRWHIITGTEVR